MFYYACGNGTTGQDRRNPRITTSTEAGQFRSATFHIMIRYHRGMTNHHFWHCGCINCLHTTSSITPAGRSEKRANKKCLSNLSVCRQTGDSGIDKKVNVRRGPVIDDSLPESSKCVYGIDTSSHGETERTEAKWFACLMLDSVDESRQRHLE